MKKYNRSYAKRATKRQNKIRKTLGFLLLLAIAFTAYAGYLMEFPEYAVATVNVEVPQKDTRTIKEQVWDMLDSYGLTIDEKIKAVSIIDCESNWDRYAVGVNKNSKDWGLWQINSVHKLSKECMFDVECSTKWAVEKYRKDKSWGAWTCS